jgi:hypothetical protein
MKTVISKNNLARGLKVSDDVFGRIKDEKTKVPGLTVSAENIWHSAKSFLSALHFINYNFVKAAACSFSRDKAALPK